ncbi:Phosphatidylglycerol/phosphatidylinositol transfer protein [Gnomoniopsis smithogilvyi]|uniref:Phosphatidylglycerol/phosphatidylinositol transfer protein n=1 Tax=Gnomoniopsis smithogilvyi TaxID=1191159 RepID=A0A9W8YX61_9PEZI|nr:Phosphatidylglycerol/phosphatidylinositol transfer protein [Gnomoniopsis smithogilvyi]
MALLGLASPSSTTDLLTADIATSENNITSLNAPTPVEFYPCKKFTLDNNIFDVKEITLDPNPPKKGTDVRIVARGHLKETIAQGAYLKATIKKGALKHTLDFDFCKGIEAGCPVAAGDVEFWTGQYISKRVPRGKAKIQFRPYTVDHRIMGCVEVPITVVKS